MKFITLFLSSLLLLISCSSNEKQSQLIEDISFKSLQKSNKALSQLSSTNYESMREKLRDRSYGEHAVFWNNKATTLKALTLEILQKIESLDIKSKSANDTLSVLKEKYISDIIVLDSSLEKRFKSEIDSFSINHGLTISPLFNTELAKNDILILESQFSGYFNNKLQMIIEDYTKFSAIVGQNATHLRTGEVLEITAGIGSYTVAAKPTFTINGKIISPTEDAVAVYKLKVDGSGKKTIPVIIMFTGPDGQKESKEFMLEYYVDK